MRFAVLGDPIAHSRSPRMHMAAYRALGLAHTYEARRVPAGEPRALAEAIDDLRRGLFDGYNVTAPHKSRVLDFVDATDESARVPGCANTLVRSTDGKVTAYNTDVPAIATQLRELAHVDLVWPKAQVLVLGTGGAARATLVACVSLLGVRRIVVRGRTQGTAFASFATDLARSFPELSVEIEALSPRLDDGRFDAIVQATSATDDTVAGAVSWKHLSESAIALDVVYGTNETAFVAAGLEAGLRSVSGLGMLVAQGALSFERWLGIPAPSVEMYEAVRDG